MRGNGRVKLLLFLNLVEVRFGHFLFCYENIHYDTKIVLIKLNSCKIKVYL